MKYFFVSPIAPEGTYITYEQALQKLLTTYKDNESTREMLQTPGEIPYKYGTIEVIEQ